MRPFRAKLCTGDRDLGEVRGEIDEAGGGDGSRQGHFEWSGSLGLLSGSGDLRLEFPEAEGGRAVYINALPRTASRDAQPPYFIEFRSTAGPARGPDERGTGELPHTMK